jgi:hypothetical protein
MIAQLSCMAGTLYVDLATKCGIGPYFFLSVGSIGHCLPAFSWGQEINLYQFSLLHIVRLRSCFWGQEMNVYQLSLFAIVCLRVSRSPKFNRQKISTWHNRKKTRTFSIYYGRQNSSLGKSGWKVSCSILASTTKAAHPWRLGCLHVR